MCGVCNKSMLHIKPGQTKPTKQIQANGKHKSSYAGLKKNTNEAMSLSMPNQAKTPFLPVSEGAGVTSCCVSGTSSSVTPPNRAKPGQIRTKPQLNQTSSDLTRTPVLPVSCTTGSWTTSSSISSSSYTSSSVYTSSSSSSVWTSSTGAEEEDKEEVPYWR